MMSAPSIRRSIGDDVAHEHSHDAKPARGPCCHASADRAWRFDHFALRHDHLSSNFEVPHPGSKTAAAEVHQPGSPAAAVTHLETVHASNIPPCAPMTAAASSDAAAFSSELPSAGDRQAVAAIGPALVAAADRDSMNATTLRVIAASSIAAKSSFVSARA